MHVGTAAQGLQQMPSRFGQDVAAGEDPAHGEDDRGDVGGERGVHQWPHPGPDRRTGRLAPLKQPVDHPLPELQERGDTPPREQLV
ncbi:hypothetical protein [Streptomyces sp. NBC_01334]|uniref:hypothetical protein n=1 Tax=Streptomyces sp. NBC_01334 TaxID=2903827 RepID=UPI002E147132|nr:hypothetical protein OG736_45735 [Streptomyces sp. NBC_01334]